MGKKRSLVFISFFFSHAHVTIKLFYVLLNFTCYVRPPLALLDVEMKRLTVVLNSIHNPGNHKAKCYIISYTI